MIRRQTNHADNTRPARLGAGLGTLVSGSGIGPYRAGMPARVSPLMFPARGLHSRLYAPRVDTAVSETVPPSARISREPEAAVVAACIMPPSDPGADETQTPYACHPTTASPTRERPSGKPFGLRFVPSGVVPISPRVAQG